MSDPIPADSVDFQAALDHPRIKHRLDREKFERENIPGPKELWCAWNHCVVEIESDCEVGNTFGPCPKISQCRSYQKAKKAMEEK